MRAATETRGAYNFLYVALLKSALRRWFGRTSLTKLLPGPNKQSQNYGNCNASRDDPRLAFGTRRQRAPKQLEPGHVGRPLQFVRDS